MACADVDLDIHPDGDEPCTVGQRRPPVIQRYEATELMKDKEGPLHDLMQKQPAVLGSLQVASGLFSVGVGVIFAVTQDMRHSLFTLFRVSQMTGVLFMFAGVLTTMLFRYPVLLPVTFRVNLSCIIAAIVAASLISVDLSHWSPGNAYLKMEVLELCVLGLEVFLSAVLCFWFFKETRRKSPRA